MKRLIIKYILLKRKLKKTIIFQPIANYLIFAIKSTIPNSSINERYFNFAYSFNTYCITNHKIYLD